MMILLFLDFFSTHAPSYEIFSCGLFLAFKTRSSWRLVFFFVCRFFPESFLQRSFFLFFFVWRNMRSWCLSLLMSLWMLHSFILSKFDYNLSLAFDPSCAMNVCNADLFCRLKHLPHAASEKLCYFWRSTFDCFLTKNVACFFSCVRCVRHCSKGVHSLAEKVLSLVISAKPPYLDPWIATRKRMQPMQDSRTSLRVVKGPDGDLKWYCWSVPFVLVALSSFSFDLRLFSSFPQKNM